MYKHNLTYSNFKPQTIHKKLSYIDKFTALHICQESSKFCCAAFWWSVVNMYEKTSNYNTLLQKLKPTLQISMWKIMHG